MALFYYIINTAEELTWRQGGVNAATGTLNTAFSDNWYADIQIPKGAKKVRFLTFKTSGGWGSVFLQNDSYLSGYCDRDVGYHWVTLEIPENATVFRYGYLQDHKTEEDQKEMFRYVEFIGADIEAVPQLTKKMERPENGPQGLIENYKGELVQYSESIRLAIEFFRGYEP